MSMKRLKLLQMTLSTKSEWVTVSYSGKMPLTLPYKSVPHFIIIPL
jgi:hypothetical protein